MYKSTYHKLIILYGVQQKKKTKTMISVMCKVRVFVLPRDGVALSPPIGEKINFFYKYSKKYI